MTQFTVQLSILVSIISLCFSTEQTKWYPYQATVRAYSIHDTIDKEFHDARNKSVRYLTSTGRDAEVWTEGIAGPKSLANRMVKLSVQGFSQYGGNGPYRIDDTGGNLRKQVKESKELHLELRFPTTQEAKKFGVKTMTVYLDTPNWKGEP